MSEGIELGLTLMAIGMTMVFAILLLVVGGASVLIRVVNRYFPEMVKVASSIDPKKVAVLAAVVSTVTHGKGTIQEVKKIK